MAHGQRASEEASCSNLALQNVDAEHDHARAAETGKASEEAEEQAALHRILTAFRQYENETGWEVARWERNFRQLPPLHQQLLAAQPAKFLAARQHIHTNQRFIRAVLSAFVDQAELQPHVAPALLAGSPDAAADGGAGVRILGAAGGWQDVVGPRVSAGDLEKVQYVLKNLVRDWSAEGAAERAQSYGRILGELQARLGGALRPGAPPPRVLVPGAGLARLCVEIAALGFDVEGNEFSYYMLITSAFMLNAVDAPSQWTLYPWLHNNCNQLSDAEQLRGIAIPDITPSQLLAGQPPGLLSMCAGDFVEVYSGPQHAATYDCVTTCFFIDTAHNIIEYMQVISHVLKEGGLWINLGPLMYHWADSHLYLESPELSIEISLEDVERIAGTFGFRTLQRSMVPATYNANLRSMMQMSYRAAFWTVVKDSTE